jgi:hypothetical protein
MPSLGFWDFALIVLVALQATALAYIHRPEWKAFVLTLPVPFTFATIALGRPIDATNMLGLINLLVFTHAVRLLHYRMRVPIVPSIVLAALLYVAIGSWAAPFVSSGDLPFWIAAALTLALGLALWALTPGRDERGHRSPLPFWIKLPAIAAVVLSLVLIKGMLGGFMTIFPMVGVISAYEMRHSLWTTCRQIPVIMVTLALLMAASRLVEPVLGRNLSLVAGWAAFVAALAILTRGRWIMAPGPARVGPPAAPVEGTVGISGP